MERVTSRRTPMAEIDDYLAGLEAEDARIIGDAYATARTLVPEAEQGISYGMPALIFHSRPLLSLMRAKGHIGIYPYSAVVVAAALELSLIHISEPTRLGMISYAVFCLK